VAIVLGGVILWRTVPIAISPPAILIGLAFIGFGVYRLWLGYTRLRQLKNNK
jgi:tellurite resistance protein TehA-like permease